MSLELSPCNGCCAVEYRDLQMPSPIRQFRQFRCLLHFTELVVMITVSGNLTIANQKSPYLAAGAVSESTYQLATSS